MKSVHCEYSQLYPVDILSLPRVQSGGLRGLTIISQDFHCSDGQTDQGKGHFLLAPCYVPRAHIFRRRIIIHADSGVTSLCISQALASLSSPREAEGAS